MRKVIHKLMQILDGTPQVYGKPARGQSLVELGLVTPVLIILIMGLAEIGWFANNYLILLEVTRTGARYGTVQTGDATPLVWEQDEDRAERTYYLRKLSYAPPTLYKMYRALNPAYNNDYSQFLVDYTTTVTIPSLGDFTLNAAGDSAPQAIFADQARDCRLIQTINEYARFYGNIACRMLNSLTPLEFRDGRNISPGSTTAGTIPGTNGIDDIVISAFSLLAVDPDQRYFSSNTDVVRPTVAAAISTVPGFPSTAKRVVVVGRYPEVANECTYLAGTANGDIRDPFNYINLTTNYTEADTRFNTYVETDTQRNFRPLQTSVTPLDGLNNRFYLELQGYDNDTTANPEIQRGWAFTGQHVIRATRNPASWNAIWGRNELVCFGSEWSSRRVEELVNLANFNLNLATTQEAREFLPSQGIVLVEMFWMHSLLLRNPVFNPVFTILNDPNVAQGAAEISVWAAFPLPSTEPQLKWLPKTQ